MRTLTVFVCVLAVLVPVLPGWAEQPAISVHGGGIVFTYNSGGYTFDENGFLGSWSVAVNARRNADGTSSGTIADTIVIHAYEFDFFLNGGPLIWIVSDLYSAEITGCDRDTGEILTHHGVVFEVTPVNPTGVDLPDIWAWGIVDEGAVDYWIGFLNNPNPGELPLCPEDTVVAFNTMESGNFSIVQN